MSVFVKHLNADSSFLLTFSPEPYPSPEDLRASYGAYTVLIDPWLTGESVVTAPWFAVTKHTTPACIQHLSQIEVPDVVIVSQNKPDHCHQTTLRQLRPDGKTVIAAEPGAARAIKKWNYFDPARVISLPKYNPSKRFTYFRVHLPPLSRGGHDGELTISFIPAKNYLTGLHNAIGITYQPPTHFKSAATMSTFELTPKTEYSRSLLSPASLSLTSPLLPPTPIKERSGADDENVDGYRMIEKSHNAGTGDQAPRLFGSGPYSTSLTESLHPQIFSPYSRSRNSHGPISPTSPTTPPFSPTSMMSASTSELSPGFDLDTSSFVPFSKPTPTPPASPDPHRAGLAPYRHQRSLSTTSFHSGITPGRPRPVSVIYTPHGIPFSDLLPYTQHHLVKLGALPLNLLLHSFDKAQNPWLLGGNIMAGSDGGVEIARKLMARCWISAHDEAKEKKGVSVAWLKEMRISPEIVRKALWEGEEGEWLGKKGWNCDVRSLGIGAEIFVGQTRDLVSRMEEKGESQVPEV